jgi:hypothetical protein
MIEWRHTITVKAVLHMLLIDDQILPQSVHLLVLQAQGHEALVCMALQLQTVAVMEDF